MFSKRKQKFCKYCWIDFNESEHYVVCCGPCKSLFHPKCAKIKNSKNFRKLEKHHWYCEICRRLKNLKLFLRISVCDDYSLPIDFVKKRPSSFDPCLAETLPDNWAVVAPSPLSEHVSFLDPPLISKIPQQQLHQSLLLQKPKTKIKLIEGYSDPKDSKKHSRNYNRKTRKERQRIKNYSSDSSAPKSSADEEERIHKVPELNSPDSITDDLIKPLQSFKSPKKLIGIPEVNKRNPSPYYYSDLLKSKDNEKEVKAKSRQSTASEPPQSVSTSNTADLPPPTYRKSTSLDVPDVNKVGNILEDFPEQSSAHKRYSITEEGVRIIRCQSPSTSTSDDSDCSECQQRREWHAKALALVRKTCNITAIHHHHPIGLRGGAEPPIPNINQQSMPPHRILGPAVCACAAPAPGLGDEIEEYFRPRSIFYVHSQGVHGCEDCITTNNVNTVTSDKSNNSSNKSRKQQQNEDEMSSGGGRTRQIYETAFDCKIAKSDDDLDEVDRVTNHSILLQLESGGGLNNANNNIKKPPHGRSKSSKSNKTRLESKRAKNSKNHAIQQDGSVSTLSNDLENIHIVNNVDENNANTNTSQLPIRGYTPSPPSTAPLPVKFPGKHDRFFMNSSMVNQSAPNLPSNPAHPRLKDLRLPVQSLRHQISNDSSIMDSGTGAATGSIESNVEPRNRHRSIVLESGRVLELRKPHHHHHHRRGNNYSSTESMATSSSGGSMESLRSSTSEGNRSTTSSESRHSTSLSSHSSESAHSVPFPLRAPILLHSKLHILSPISDKSSLEPASDASELNKKMSPNNGEDTGKLKLTSQIASGTTSIPEEPKTITSENGYAAPNKQIKRRPPPNKNLLHLTDEILGSDSGISLHSREDGKSAFQRFGLPKLNFPNNGTAQDKSDLIINSGSLGLPQDLRDLPFDMPKLRRRKILVQQDGCTSGSATSVDLGDLPFDMPKLRRRLRLNQPQTNNLVAHSTESSGISQASSSHSVDQNNKPHGMESNLFRQNLTLNFNELKTTNIQNNKFGSLELRQNSSSSKGLNLNISSTGIVASAVDLIDVAIPLERQGWYHGAITRIDAETTLRPLNEGSFLVRNCESTKQDYSLSLKGAKGFMHMRIQRNDSNQYILGQFSRPFDSVPEMIRHFCINRLPVRGAEHMCLLDPVIAQLL